jgi:hypothetical protein
MSGQSDFEPPGELRTADTIEIRRSGFHRSLLSAAESRGEDIQFRRVGPAGSRLDMPDLFEIPFQVGKKPTLSAALEDLCEKGTSWREDLPGKIRRRLGEPHDAQVIGFLVAGGIGRHVRHDEVGLAAQAGDQDVWRLLVEEVEFEEVDTCHGLNGKKVDGDDPASSLGEADLAGCDLRPAARSRAKIHDALARLEELVLLVDLDQLIGGTGTVAFPLRPSDIGVVDLALQPLLGRERPTAGGLQALLPSRQTLSSRIRFMRIPSRNPRSAMRRRSLGKARRIASRIAHPARTRSARSRPMQGFDARAS